jgi:LysR family nod box-dependent transcriptional activator
MHFKGLDLNLLVALDVLLQERSITRAGERLGLSQPATSGALARLRDYFNDPLLVPVGRQMMLTPLAHSLVEPVSQVLQQVQATVATRARFDPAKSDRRFSIMASDYVFTVFFPAVLQRVEREAPGVTLQLRQLSPNWHEELNRGDIDFVIIPESFSLAPHPKAPLSQ